MEQVKGLPVGTKITKVERNAHGMLEVTGFAPDNAYEVMDLGVIPPPAGYEHLPVPLEERFREPMEGECWISISGQGTQGPHSYGGKPWLSPDARRLIIRKKKRRVLVVEHEIDEADNREDVNFTSPARVPFVATKGYAEWLASKIPEKCRIEERG